MQSKLLRINTMQLIRVERIDQSYSGKMRAPLWLIWIGEEMPPLDEIWQLYLRRFGVDRGYWSLDIALLMR